MTSRCSCCHRYYRAYPEDAWGDICAECVEWCDLCDKPALTGRHPECVEAEEFQLVSRDWTVKCDCGEDFALTPNEGIAKMWARQHNGRRIYNMDDHLPRCPALGRPKVPP